MYKGTWIGMWTGSALEFKSNDFELIFKWSLIDFKVVLIETTAHHPPRPTTHHRHHHHLLPPPRFARRGERIRI